jgi:DinB superfamily
MEELSKYRKRLIDRLPAAAKEFRAACLAVKDPFAPIEAGWNIHQLAVHTRDTDRLVYGVRARRTIKEDNPEFQNFDGEAYMATYYDAKEPLQAILNELVSSVDELAKMLRGLSSVAWTRESRHETQGGGFTLQVWIERSLKHIEEHLATVKQAK